VSTIIIIVVLTIAFIIALLASIIICKRRHAAKSCKATRTAHLDPDPENNNPPAYSQEETGPTNSVKGDGKSIKNSK
jgi:hypothetical protein